MGLNRWLGHTPLRRVLSATGNSESLPLGVSCRFRGTRGNEEGNRQNRACHCADCSGPRIAPPVSISWAAFVANCRSQRWKQPKSARPGAVCRHRLLLCGRRLLLRRVGMRGFFLARPAETYAADRRAQTVVIRFNPKHPGVHRLVASRARRKREVGPLWPGSASPDPVRPTKIHLEDGRTGWNDRHHRRGLPAALAKFEGIAAAVASSVRSQQQRRRGGPRMNALPASASPTKPGTCPKC